jgi:phage FluMu gp28-like protein
VKKNATITLRAPARSRAKKGVQIDAVSVGKDEPLPLALSPRRGARGSEQLARAGAKCARKKAVPAFFLPYQRKWITDPSRKRIMEKSRQIGISLCTAYDLVYKTSLVGNKYDAWVSSRDEMQAQLFGADCAHWSKILHLQVNESARQVIDPKEKISAHVLPFKNGRAIYSLSSNPNAQAGKRGRRVFDEFALNPDNRLLYSIGHPGTLWGGGMDIISTHRGTGNFFNELVNEVKYKGNPKGFSLHTVTLLDAVQQGLLAKLQSKWAEADPGDDRLKWKDDDFLQSLRNECVDEETWQQEFLCQPGDDQAAFLSYDLIAACEYKAGEQWQMVGLGRVAGGSPATTGGSPVPPSLPGTTGGSPVPPSLPGTTGGLPVPPSLYVGVDVGRTHDLTVIWVLEKLGDVCFTRAIHCLAQQTFDAQEELLYGILNNSAVRRCCIDQSGLGRQFSERAVQKFGPYKVEGVQFTAAVKEQLAYPVRAAFEEKKVRIPADKFIRADLRAIRKESTAAGNIRFTGERTAQGHSDRFWALALALHAAKQTTVNTIYAQLI